ncbi:MAG: cell division protein FtsA [Crocinitomicaceae bacterium]
MKDKSFAEKSSDPVNNSVVVGLDIGTTKIACFVGVKNEHGKIEIISQGKSESLGVKKGVVFNIDKTINSIKAAIEDTARNCPEGDLNLKHVVVGIAGQHIRSMQTSDSYTRKNREEEISQDDIKAFVNSIHEMVMSPGEEIITVVPQEFNVDGEQGIKDPVGMAGVRLEANFHIITGQVSNVTNIYNCVRRAGLEISEVILEPIASAEAVLSEEEKEAGIVLVDIGGGTTDVAIFHDGIIRHTAVIPFGGNIITQDIRTGCRILERHAEKLKVKFGSALASESSEKEVVCIPGLRGQKSKEITVRNLASIIEARMVEIIEKVNNEIQNSGYAKEIIGGIVITGGGSKLKHLTQLFEYLTGMDARIGYPNEHLANTNDESLTSPIFSTGIGLMLKGFEKNTRVLEPAPEEDIKKGKFFDAVLRGVENLFKD